MFFKTRKPLTDAQKFDVILEYLNAEMARWQEVASRDEPTDKADARIMYLEEQILLTFAQRSLEISIANAK